MQPRLQALPRPGRPRPAAPLPALLPALLLLLLLALRGAAAAPAGPEGPPEDAGPEGPPEDAGWQPEDAGPEDPREDPGSEGPPEDAGPEGPPEDAGWQREDAGPEGPPEDADWQREDAGWQREDAGWQPEDADWQRDAALPHGLLQQAARAALHFFHFRAGSPSALRALAAVRQGRAWINSKKECQVDLEFTTERYNPEEGEERLGNCSAQVFFRNEKPRPSVNVTCTRLVEKSKRQQEDYQLYKHLTQLKTPLDVSSIPDSHGHIDPSLRPIWDLAFLGSSYVMWEKTTQFLHYYVAQLSGVKQWKTDEDAIDFDYTVLLHEFSTQEIIPCRIHLVWHPSKPLKVKYHCQGPQPPEEASGTEEGSAAAPTGFSNY